MLLQFNKFERLIKYNTIYKKEKDFLKELQDIKDLELKKGVIIYE